jgi:hypothetical protein
MNVVYRTGIPEVTTARLAPIAIGATFRAEHTKNWSVAHRRVGYVD